MSETTHKGSVSKILEPIGRQGRIDGRARDRAMTEPPLNRPGVVTCVGKRVAAGLAKHVRMRLQFEPGADGRTLHHAGKASGRERRAALADEDEV
jgi:hypothetical protein